ncbi:MAG: xanthine permease [Erysipelotrichaceae bacterium]|jgi:uracil permease|nr:xanthine permease [Erysipelotrichaceae bacterium]
MSSQEKTVSGYLPDEKPTLGRTLLFGLQQILVMFPATVTVAMLTGFHVSTTIFASGLATLCFLFVTKGKLPLYYGSSFSYISAIVGMTGASYGVVASDDLIGRAQFGIIASGLVSIAAGIIIDRFGQDKIDKILPATITGAIAMVIGISLAGSAMTSAFAVDASGTNTTSAIIAVVTLVSTVAFSVFLKKGILGQVPILLGILVGYLLSLLLNYTGAGDIGLQTKLATLFQGNLVTAPHFTLPVPNLAAVIAIMPIAIATIPESTAHLFQLDIYVNDLAKKKGKPKYDIEKRLGINLIGDGLGDMISAAIGGPAGTNYGENLSTMAITHNFSVWVLGAAAIITMIISFFSPLTNFVNSIPGPVINGACIYLFGVIGAQGIAILINKGVDMFDAKNLAIIAVILIIGLGGSYGFSGSNIPIGSFSLPAIATASVAGIVLNLVLSIKKT